VSRPMHADVYVLDLLSQSLIRPGQTSNLEPDLPTVLPEGLRSTHRGIRNPASRFVMIFDGISLGVHSEQFAREFPCRRALAVPDVNNRLIAE